MTRPRAASGNLEAALDLYCGVSGAGAGESAPARTRFVHPDRALLPEPMGRTGGGETSVFWLKILGGVAALAFGIYLGLAGEYRQRPEEIDAVMERGGRRPYQVRRRFTPLDLLKPKRRGSERRAGGRRRAFQLSAGSGSTSKPAPPPPPANTTEGEAPERRE